MNNVIPFDRNTIPAIPLPGPIQDWRDAVTYMTAAYMEAVYFTESGDPEDPVDPDARLSAGSYLQAWRDCYLFLQLIPREWIQEWDMGQLGHDLWLTRNGHGAGFWDRSLPYAAEITARCNAHFKQVYAFTENGITYLE